MASNLIIIFCRTHEEASYAGAKLGHIENTDRFFIFLGHTPSASEISWMTEADRTMNLERVIEHPLCEELAVKTGVIYSNFTHWNLLFCWAHECPSKDNILDCLKQISSSSAYYENEFVWGNIRENMIIDGFEAVYRKKQILENQNNQSDSEFDFIMAMNGIEASTNSVIKSIAETASMTSVGLHPLSKSNTKFINEIQMISLIAGNFVQENPSTYIICHSGNVSATAETIATLPPQKTAIVFTEISDEASIIASSEIKPYRVLKSKDGFSVLLFKIQS